MYFFCFVLFCKTVLVQAEEPWNSNSGSFWGGGGGGVGGVWIIYKSGRWMGCDHGVRRILLRGKPGDNNKVRW